MALLLALAPTPARAESLLDVVEYVFGSTNINAATGHGQLAEGISQDGDVTVLSWPNPSYADQLGYISSNDIHAHDLPHFGSPEGAGLFLGLLLEHRDGRREVTWLRDRTQWQIQQNYGDDDGPNIVTLHSSASFGLSVTVTDAIKPPGGAADILVRQVDVRRTSDSSVTAAWLLTYANLSPTPPDSRIPELPIVDWAFDGSNDFAAVWDAANSAVIHFHPQNQLVYRQISDLISAQPPNYGPIGEQLKRGAPSIADLASLVANLDNQYAPGAYIALTTQPLPDEHQIGQDATPLCALRDTLVDNIMALPTIFPSIPPSPTAYALNLLRCSAGPPTSIREGWVYGAADAFADAQDGELQDAGTAAGEVNEALRTPLTFEAAESGSQAYAAAVLSFAANATTARAAAASAEAAQQIVQAAKQALAAWESTVVLPTAGPPIVRTVARRSLINLRVGTDIATGTAVASIARQPPYYLDWPRDGTILNMAFDVSGQSAMAGKRADLLIARQRMKPVRATPSLDPPPPVDPDTGQARSYPADAWEMNYFPDDAPGGPIRFEIDNTGLALWSIVKHVGWVPPAEAAGYLSNRWEPVARGANLLARWRDPANKLQALANEADNGVFTQTLYGAVTVYLGLDIAARAAHFLGHDHAARRWELRACELRNAVTTLLYDPTSRRFVSNASASFDPATTPLYATAFLVWPGRLLPWDDTRIADQLAGDLQAITPTIELQNGGGAYFMMNTLVLALARGNDSVLGPLIAAARDKIAIAHVTAATHQFGEVMVVKQGPNGPLAEQHVAGPQLQESLLFYLTSMAIEHPEAFELYNSRLPASAVPPPGSTCIVPPECVGDCDAAGLVSIDDLLTGVKIVLEQMPLADCPSFDASGDRIVTVDELLRAVNAALGQCPGTEGV